MTTERKKYYLLGIFVMALVLANTLGAKIAEFPIPNWLALPFNVIVSPLVWILNFVLVGFGNEPLSYAFFNIIHVSVGILTVPLMFLVIDVVHESLGKEVSKEFIKVGMFSMLVMIGITVISVMLPPAERFMAMNDSYSSIFGTTIRMAIASILAFYVSQMNDIWTFHLLRHATAGKYYWLRKNLSTFIGELLDSTIFMFVAFYHPANFPAPIVIKLIIPYFIFKMMFAILDTPFSYLAVKWMRDGMVKEGMLVAEKEAK